MRQDEELWMKKVKEALKDHAESPPPGGWQRLEKELRPSAGKRIYQLRWWAVAASLLAAVSLVSLLFLRSPVVDEVRKSSGPLASVPDVMPDNKEPEVVSVQVDPAIRSTVAQSNVKKENYAQPLTVREIKEISETEQTPNDQEAPEEKTEEQPEVVIKNDETQKETPVIKPSGRDKMHIPVTRKKASGKSNWSVGASVSNISSVEGAGNEHPQKTAPTPPSITLSDASSGVIKVPDDYELDFKNGLPNFASNSDAAKYKHHQPISFGLSVRKGLAKGFSLETGLTYTQLNSDVEYISTKNNVEQKLHYIGLPIRANWNFLDSKLFTVYLSAGGMIEKSVYGKRGDEKLSVKELQFSVAGSVGAQINATKNIGLYIEPGVSYFFDDGSNVQTIRKDTPFNFNLQAGLRFTY